jgi:hypothetical protein
LRLATDVRRPPPSHDAGMSHRDRLSELRDEEARERYAIRRAERRMTREARRLRQELQDFDEDEATAVNAIEAEWRAEHYGREPDRPPAWRRR